jgi:hypothetical protein
LFPAQTSQVEANPDAIKDCGAEAKRLCPERIGRLQVVVPTARERAPMTSGGSPLLPECDRPCYFRRVRLPEPQPPGTKGREQNDECK